MFFVSNRDFHRAPNVIVIDADSFPLYFRIFRKLALPPFCCLSDRHSSREKKGPGCWLTRTIENLFYWSTVFKGAQVDGGSLHAFRRDCN